MEYGKYQMSLMYNIASNWYNPNNEWWTEMTERVYVGAIPLKDNSLLSYYYKNESHGVILKNLGITDVISINKKFELNSRTLISNPVLNDEWKSLEITQHIFETSDFEAIDLDIIEECVNLMEQLLKDVYKKIYLHCKAGRGRSMIIYICYMLKKNKTSSVDDILRYVNEKRSISSLNSQQLQNINDYWMRYVLHEEKTVEPVKLNEVSTVDVVNQTLIVQEPVVDDKDYSAVIEPVVDNAVESSTNEPIVDNAVESLTDEPVVDNAVESLTNESLVDNNEIVLQNID